jgi:UDP-glucose 4-epimerase
VTRSFVAGGAGFIGSHLVRRLLAEDEGTVVVYDNFCSGNRWHLEGLGDGGRLEVVEADIEDTDTLRRAMEGADHVFHLAANADIAAAVSDPGIDFWSGTFLTHQVLEAVRVTGTPRMTYTSGSGVYGDQGLDVVDESFGPLLPVSTYGASKLAGEGLLASYCHLFGVQGVAFRFANVIGPRQTHGVVYDFVRKLLKDPTTLDVLGNGTQSKSYIHVDDVLDAIFLMRGRPEAPFDVFNVGTDDYVSVAEIAEIVIETMGLDGAVTQFGEEPRGWRGDVPIVRFSSEKIRGLGWTNRYSSQDALRESARAILAEATSEH